LGLAPDFKFTQQDLTELNGDGNRERGRYGEDQSTPKVKPPLTGSPEIATEIENSQKEDRIVPFLEQEIAEEYRAAFEEEDENPSW
jgi:hypothetical protein|tara:strand:- start:566 stop:823 length:258 start_codon:yes stop_codon:yes gene_type:complete